MIRRLRTKFICVTMTIVTVMLALLLMTQYSAARSSLEQISLAALEAAAQEPMRGYRPGFEDRGPEQPCFALSVDNRGVLRVSGDGYYDLSDTETLMDIYQAAVAGDAPTGVLAEYSLRYCRAEVPVDMMELRYVFTDISGEIQTLRELVRSSILIAVLGFFCFLILSVLLAEWAVRPVEQSWEQQRQFVADASHELKTPLTVILTNAELLEDPRYEAAQRQQFADSILTMAYQMRGLVEDMLQLARADCGQSDAQLEKLDFSRLVEQTLLTFEPLYFEHGLTLESDVQPGVALTGCESRLRQVVEILLDNGQKYSTPGAAVRLTLQSRGSQCYLTVSGPGQTLTARQCRDIFKRFYRVDQARTRNGGYGLGLAIAQRIVQDHRGRIWAEGKDGINTFYVNLPLN